MADSNDTPGVLLVGHGTRDAEGKSELFELARRVSRRLVVPVEPCFLELCPPTIHEAAERLLRSGRRHVLVSPVLLFEAEHAKSDVPAAVDAALDKWAIRHQTAHLGCHPKIVELSAHRCSEAVAGDHSVDQRATLVLLVGRGSHDQDATAEMYQFVQLRAVAAAPTQFQVCFLGLANPRLEEVLAEVRNSSFGRVIVQPHLLFQGELVTKTRKLAETMPLTDVTRQWISTSHLGPHPLLVDAVCARIQGAWPHQDLIR